MDEQTLEFEKNQHKIPEKKAHWRKLMGKEFLVGEELGGKPVTLTVKEVKQQELTSARGAETKITCSFMETDRKIVLNTTNCKKLTELSGSGFIQDWVGLKVVWHTERITAFGNTTDALRIKELKK